MLAVLDPARHGADAGPGVLDHMAFWATDLAGFLARLEQRGIIYDLRRVPEGGPAAGVWQLFFHDPNGARVEIDLAASEAAPPSSENSEINQ